MPIVMSETGDTASLMLYMEKRRYWGFNEQLNR